MGSYKGSKLQGDLCKLVVKLETLNNCIKPIKIHKNYISFWNINILMLVRKKNIQGLDVLMVNDLKHNISILFLSGCQFLPYSKTVV